MVLSESIFTPLEGTVCVNIWFTKQLFVETSTDTNFDNQNVDRPKRQQTKTSTDQNFDTPKRFTYRQFSNTRRTLVGN